jgi:hypothetical protein
MTLPQPIRLAPSGPDVASDDGGAFAPGTGAVMRSNERTTQIGPTTNIIDTTQRIIGSQLLADPNATQLVAQLASPDPKKNYRASVRLDVFNTIDDTVINAILRLFASADGITWTELLNNEHGIAPAVTGAASPDGEHADSGGFRQIELTRPMFLGGPAFGVVAGDAALMIRATIEADAAGAFADSRNISPGNFGTVLLRLEECF